MWSAHLFLLVLVLLFLLVFLFSLVLVWLWFPILAGQVVITQDCKETERLNVLLLLLLRRRRRLLRLETRASNLSVLDPSIASNGRLLVIPPQPQPPPPLAPVDVHLSSKLTESRGKCEQPNLEKK